MGDVTHALVIAPAMLAVSQALFEPYGSFEPVAVLSGVPEIIDGDGLAFGNVEVRLQGIFARETARTRATPGGPEATRALASLVGGRDVTCYLDGITASSNSPVTRREIGGSDLGHAPVEAGYDRDCPRYSSGDFSEAERAARAAGRDLSEIY